MRGRFPALQGLRLVAFVFVFLAHAAGNGYAHVLYLANLGSVSVQFFFVLSGFLCAYHHLAAGAPALGPWYGLRRVRRFYPLHFATFLAMAALLAAQGAAWDGPLLRSALLQVFLLQSWSVEAAISFNGAAWFVSCLCAIYAALPFFVRWTRALSQRQVLAVFSLLVVCRCAVDVFYLREWSCYGVDPAVVWLYVCPLSRVSDFLLGFWGWRLLAAAPVPASEGARSLRLGALLVLLAALMVLCPPFPGARHCLPVMVSLLLLLVVWAACAPGRLFLRLLGGGLLARGGDLSFEMYLIHLPVLHWLLFLWPQGGVFGGLATCLVSLVISLGVHRMRARG